MDKPSAPFKSALENISARCFSACADDPKRSVADLQLLSQRLFEAGAKEPHVRIRNVVAQRIGDTHSIRVELTNNLAHSATWPASHEVCKLEVEILLRSLLAASLQLGALTNLRKGTRKDRRASARGAR